MEVQNERKSSKIKIGSLLLVSFLLIYIPSLIHWVYGRDISTEMIRIGVIEDSTSLEGSIIRDEEVLKSPFEGKCIPSVNEGEKIPASYRVATILKDSTQKISDELKEIDLKIIKARKEKNENQDFFSEDIAKLDNEIGQKVKVIINDINAHSFEKAGLASDEIDAFIQKKASIMGGPGTGDAFLNNLNAEKQKLQEQINFGRKEVVSSSAGIISYAIDGYEDTLNPLTIKDLTPKAIDEIKVKESTKSQGVKKTDIQKPFAKVIKGIDYYVAMSIEPRKAQMWKVGDNIKIRINDVNKVIDGTVDFISNEQDGKCIFSVKIDKYMSETSGLRKVNIDLIRSSYRGWKVPVKSLKEINLNDMKAKIVLVKANYASIRDVKIVGKNEEFAIIENIEGANRNGVSLYDMFVLNPGNIQEGQMISK